MASISDNLSNVISLPASGASITRMGEQFQPNLYTGTGSFTVTVELPPTRKGFAPELKLCYDTGSGNGPFGHGWVLTQLGITRSTKIGVPSYLPSDESFILAGAEELIAFPSELYRPKTDFAGWEVRKTGDFWKVTTKDGLVYALGITNSTRIANKDRVFSWLLEKVESPTGENAEYKYFRDSDLLYLDTITYGPFIVQFTYEQRPDPIIFSKAGFPIVTRLRCTSIRINSVRSPLILLRQYSFSYINPEPAYTSLLEEITLSGGSASTQITMPPMTFEYTRLDTSVQKLTEFSAEAGSPRSLLSPDTTLVDLSGNGLPDVVTGSPAGWRRWKNKGEGQWAKESTLINVPAGFSLGDPQISFADLEANGTADILIGKPARWGYLPNAARDDWETFVPYAVNPTFDLSEPNFRMYDIDGDGKFDGLYTGNNAFVLYKNLGRSGWSSIVTRINRIHDLSLFPDVSFEDPNVHVADMTGDGLQDIVLIRKNEIWYWPYLGHGNWGKRHVMADSPMFGQDFIPTSIKLADLSGDGTADLIYLEPSRARVWFNRSGAGYSEEKQVNWPLNAGRATIADILGTGKAGFLLSSPLTTDESQPFKFLSFGGVVPPGLLTTVNNGLGHKTTIEYCSSTTFRLTDERAGRQWSTFLPFPVNVVSAIEIFDSFKDSKARTSFHYSDGHYDGVDREFRGFGIVEEHTPGDVTTPAVKRRHQFHLGTEMTFNELQRRNLDQGERDRLRSLRGSPIMVESYELLPSGTERLVSRTVSEWHTFTVADTSFVKIYIPYTQSQRTVNFGASGDNQCLTKRILAIDKIGNVLEEETEVGRISNGIYSIDSSVRVQRKYVIPTPGISNITGLIAEEISTDHTSSLLSVKRNFFDGDSFVGLPLGRVARGLLMRTEQLITIANYPGYKDNDMYDLGFHRSGSDTSVGWYTNSQRSSYGEDGNLQSVKDALGHVVTLEYDPWGIFPVSATDESGRMIKASVDYTVEMIDAIYNPNGTTEKRVYDAMGRTLAVYSTTANGTISLRSVHLHDHGDPTELMPASLTSIYSKKEDLQLSDIEAQVKTGEFTSDVIVNRIYYDGSGAELQALIESGRSSDDKPVYVRSGYLSFNNQGKVSSQTNPTFYSTLSYKQPEAAIPEYSFKYDVNGNIRQLQKPLGETRTALFSPCELKVFDENYPGHGAPPSLLLVNDAAKRLVSVDQQLEDEISRTFRYFYTSQGLLSAIWDSNMELVAEIEYDKIGRKIQCRHRDAGNYRYFYDAIGNLIGTEEPDGKRMYYDYDSTGRQLSQSLLLSDGKLNTIRRFVYDSWTDGSNVALGKLCEVIDTHSVIKMTYAPNGCISRKERHCDGVMLAMEYEYNLQGLPSVITYPNGVQLRYEYDSRGLISQIQGFLNEVEYSPFGLPVKVVYSSGVIISYEYDANNHLIYLDAGNKEGVKLLVLEYEYDLAGNIITYSDTRTKSGKVVKRYTYDLANRVRSVSVEDPTGIERFEITYDASGNMLTNEEGDLTSTGYLDPIRKGLLTDANLHGQNIIIEYDTCGRRVKKGNHAYQYDEFGKLSVVTKADAPIISLMHDFEGHRLLKRINSQTEAHVTHYFTSFFEKNAESEVMYIYGVPGLLAQVKISQGNLFARFFIGDHLGSCLMVTDETGLVVNESRYTTFGQKAWGENKDDKGYAGMSTEDELGLIQFGDRYYDLETCRFITPDLWLLGSFDVMLSNPEALNLYAYAVNNPIRYKDPRGRFAIIALVIIGAVIGAAIGAKAAAENGKNPLVGALIGAVVGGLAGGYGLLGSALIGAGLGGGVALATGQNFWTGAAIGFAFGAFGGAISRCIPIVGGEGFAVDAANFAIEVGSDAAVSGLSAGTTAAIEGKSFGSAFESGAIMGAAIGAVRVAAVGVRFNPQNQDAQFRSRMEAEWKIQSKSDQHNYLSAKVNQRGMPDVNNITFRRNGLLANITGRSFGIGDISLDDSTIREMQGGNYHTLAHEVRHIAQQQAASGGVLEFLAVWTYQYFTTSDKMYSFDSKNITLEPYY